MANSLLKQYPSLIMNVFATKMNDSSLIDPEKFKYGDVTYNTLTNEVPQVLWRYDTATWSDKKNSQLEAASGSIGTQMIKYDVKLIAADEDDLIIMQQAFYQSLFEVNSELPRNVNWTHVNNGRTISKEVAVCSVITGFTIPVKSTYDKLITTVTASYQLSNSTSGSFTAEKISIIDDD